MEGKPAIERRLILAGLSAWTLGSARAQAGRFRIGFANIDERPGVTLEGLGFTGAQMRRSFELAARTLPVDMLYWDNAGDPARAVANAEAAVAAKLDLMIEYNADPEANAQIADRLGRASIPIIALVHPIPSAPLYGPDDRAAGLIAGRALGAFARDTWPGENVLGVLIGDLADPGKLVGDRIEGITAGVHETLPGLELAPLDTDGQPSRAEAVITRFLQAQRGRRVLIATLDDMTALHARNAIEMARRQSDCIIVSQGVDPNIHGGASEKKELDPGNRGSMVLGSVAYFMDRYGYEVLPLALRQLSGEALPPRTVTRHRLVTAANVFREYPPTDMN